MGLISAFTSLVMASAAIAQNCPIQFDGRVPAGSTAASFDATTSPFNTKFVFGQNLTMSEVVLLPDIAGSLFDTNGSLPVEVTLSDQSIFAPSATDIQTGFRRAELLPASNNGTDPSTLGLKTLHFSIMKDTARPFNLSHEYQLVFLENAAFSTNQFVLKTGTISGQPAGQDPNLLVLQGNVNAAVVQNLFNTSFTADTWHNFGVVLDFNLNTTQVLYSTNNTPLANVTAPVANDISGQGQFHFGALKKPTGNNLTDVTRQGFQESGINEGIIYGGIFEENSTGGCISLSAANATCANSS
ncbi:hypothetical protein BDZ45DRAFT_603359 [Acephala macrosclerotiorum]|nr:hypothetical protein BDZ45DRAFT_603359 [Acephala macrosclerotiorum]